ncbi:MAG: hypothetical protein V3R14_01450, partial [Nitrospinaceae bacterium]
FLPDADRFSYRPTSARTEPFFNALDAGSMNGAGFIGSWSSAGPAFPVKLKDNETFALGRGERTL